MYVVFRFEGSGMVTCYPISYWMIFDDGDAVIKISDDEPLFFRNGQWSVCGDPVQIIEMVPDIHRFMSMSPVQFKEGHGEKEQADS